MNSTYNGITFTDSDILNPFDAVYANEDNPNSIQPWLIHDQGSVVCMVFADSKSSALDIAANRGKLNTYRVEVSPWAHFEPSDKCFPLGDEYHDYDIAPLTVMGLPKPKRSWCAQFNARQQ